METRQRGLTLIEVVVTVGIVLLLALLLMAVIRTKEKARALRSCTDNLAVIGKACSVYQEPNGDFFPAYSQYDTGVTDDFKPMPSLAILYPAYIDDLRWFGCPATKDRPWISVRWNQGAKWVCFGTDVPGQPAANPVTYSGQELGTKMKCSYFYDERTSYRDIGPGQAIACDVDGQTWLLANGSKPPYQAGWTRKPRAPNHENGQNVMYFDGHVKWIETVWASRDPNDNIFCPQAGWGADTDAYLWDGVNARAAQK